MVTEGNIDGSYVVKYSPIAVQGGHGGTPRTGSKRFVGGVNCPSCLSQPIKMRPKTQLKLNGAKYGGFSTKAQVNNGE